MTPVLATIALLLLSVPNIAATSVAQANEPTPTTPVHAALPSPSPQPATTPQPAVSQNCPDVTGFHALDFWLGDWDVYVQGKLDGRDRVSAVLSGCAVTEDWTGQNGSRGMSLFYYNSFVDRWTQVWVTELATRRGGLKEKTLVARSAGSVRFQGLLPGAPGSRLILDRTTLTSQPSGRVHQVIENSLDGGATWRAAYDAIYVPHGSPPPA